MIVDCFMFHNELQMLYYRLHLLGNIVDYFIIVESSFSHSGNTKSLYFEKYKHIFPFQHKIIYVQLNQLPFLSPRNKQVWHNENYQRNMIHKGIERINLKNDDILIVSDVDEIPNPEILSKIKNNNILINSIHSLSQNFYYYNINNQIQSNWFYAKILPFSEYKEKFNSKPQLCRNYFQCPSIDNGGWHLSYFGNSDFIITKLQNFAHQEFNNKDFLDHQYLQYCIRNGKDFANRNNIIFLEKSTDNKPPLFDIFQNSIHLFIS